MFVSLNREAMILVHAFPNLQVVSDLATIELSHVHVVTLDSTDHKSWNRFTDLELKLLYRNLTGQELEGYTKAHHIGLIVAACSVLQPSDVVPFEVRMQNLKIGSADKRRWRYVKGSLDPMLETDLFEPSGLHAHAVAVQYTPAPRAAAAGPDQPVAPNSAPAAVAKAPSAPRTGSATVTIFQVADKMWTEAGEPRQLPKVLELRKRIMAVLEEQHGIKKTTSSTSLGNWQKARLNA